MIEKLGEKQLQLSYVPFHLHFSVGLAFGTKVFTPNRTINALSGARWAHFKGLLHHSLRAGGLMDWKGSAGQKMQELRDSVKGKNLAGRNAIAILTQPPHDTPAMCLD